MFKEPEHLKQPEIRTGRSLRGEGFPAKMRNKGCLLAGKMTLIAAIGLMTFGQTGCSRAPDSEKAQEKPAAASKYPVFRSSDGPKGEIIKSKETREREKMGYFDRKGKEQRQNLTESERKLVRKELEPQQMWGGKKAKAR
ncbi:MAG: hypothetical protein V1875_03935 [Candidatus Altiarchaeota archaeon]